jgi:hypothetical protein
MFSSHVVSARALFRIRALLGAYLLATALYGAITDFYPSEHGKRVRVTDGHVYLVATLSFLHYSAIALYFCGMTLMALLSQHRMHFKQLCDYNYSVVEKRSVRPFAALKALWVLFECLAPLSLLVTTVYWTILFKGGSPTFFSVHMHAVNCGVMMLELFINRLVLVPRHVVFLLLGTAAFATHAIVFHAATHAWIYKFLNLTKISAVYFYPGTLVILLLYYFLCVNLVRVRAHCGARYIAADRNGTIAGYSHSSAVGSSSGGGSGVGSTADDYFASNHGISYQPFDPELAVMSHGRPQHSPLELH